MSSYSKTNLPPSQPSIPASTPLPPGWSTNTAHLTRDIPHYFDFSAYDLPPLTPLALSRDDMAFLIYISSSGEYLLFNGISGTLYLIKRPHPNPSSSSSSSPFVSTLLQAMRDDTLETVEVDALPEEGEYADVEGWTIYPDEKLKEMKDLVPRDGDFKEKRVTLIMGRRNDEEEVLLFRSYWRYLLYKEGKIYQVEEPMKLGAIISRLIEDWNEENLKLQEVGIDRLYHMASSIF